MNVETTMGYAAYAVTAFVWTISFLISVSIAIVGISQLLCSEYKSVPLQKGRLIKAILWNTVGAVRCRKDYDGVSGAIEAYDVEWTLENGENTMRDNVWRCHLRPESLVRFYFMRSIGLRK